MDDCGRLRAAAIDCAGDGKRRRPTANFVQQLVGAAGHGQRSDAAVGPVDQGQQGDGAGVGPHIGADVGTHGGARVDADSARGREGVGAAAVGGQGGARGRRVPARAHAGGARGGVGRHGVRRRPHDEHAQRCHEHDDHNAADVEGDEATFKGNGAAAAAGSSI